jgi:hypothetical protein
MVTAPASVFAVPRTSALTRYFQISLYLLLLVSVLTLVSTGKLDIVSILLPPVALLVKGYRWWRSYPAELSPRAATWLVVGYFVFFPVDLWWISRLLASDAQNPALYSALLAAVHLMLFAMIVRLYSARTTRDFLFLAMLAFSSMLAAAILTVDTMFLLFFLLFLALAISTFISLEMQRSAEVSASTPIGTGTSAARRLNKALGFASGAIAAGALLLGTTIFFLIPRFTAGYMSGFNLQPSLISGFSDDVELGQIGQIKLSSSVVMRIEVQGDPKAAQGMHWRGIALTTFDGHRWYDQEHEPFAVSQGGDGWLSLNRQTRLAAPGQRRYVAPLQYTVLLEPMASDALFVAAEPERIRGQFVTDTNPGGAAVRRTYLVEDQTGSLSNPFHNFSNVQYEAVSEVPEVPANLLQIAGTDYSDELRSMYLQLPVLDPRIPALAKQIVGRATDPYDQAHAIENYLRGHYGYTLDLSATPPADPLASFLFQRRAGHCEYFATAMTVMLRSLGVPARYINGFLPGEYNSVGGDYIIRASDAHSWVEVFFPGYGWLTFDPTPPSEDKPAGLFAQLGFYVDWFELQWGEWIINYDFLHQYTLAQALSRASRDWTSRWRERFEEARNAGAERVRAWQTRLASAPLWFPVTLAMLVIAGLCARSRTLRERLLLAWQLRARDAALPPHTAALFYRRMLLLLERRGWRKSPAQTPLEFAASFSLSDDGAAAPVAQLTALYQASRFGGRGADAKTFAALLASLEAALRVHSAAR